MEKIKFAVIGVKGIGYQHIRGIEACKRACLTWVCDIEEAQAMEKANEFLVDKWCTNYQDLLDKEDVDAVCIATPDALHKDMVIDFLNAGKHVLCEKPLALNSEDCKMMIEAAEKSNAKLMVGQVCRMTPGFIAAKKLYDEGMIGELLFVESEYAHDYSEMPYHWRMDTTNPRHSVIGGGCHAVDLLRWIAGNPTEVYGYSNKKVLKNWPCDDSAIAVLKFPNNVMGKIFVSTGCKRNYTMRTLLYGTKGTIITDNTSDTFSLFVGEFEGKKHFAGHPMKEIEIKIPVSINNHNVSAEIEEFCQVICKEKELEITGREGAATVAVCEAIIESAKTGQPQQVKYLCVGHNM